MRQNNVQKFESWQAHDSRYGSEQNERRRCDNIDIQETAHELTRDLSLSSEKVSRVFDAVGILLDLYNMGPSNLLREREGKENNICHVTLVKNGTHFLNALSWMTKHGFTVTLHNVTLQVWSEGTIASP